MYGALTKYLCGPRLHYKYKYKYRTAHKGTGPQTSGRAASLKAHPVVTASQIQAYNKGTAECATPG